MRGKMKYKAVLFDLDGTLLDTLEDLADSMNAVLWQMNSPVHPPSSYKLFVGEGVEYLVYQALPADQRQPGTIKKCVALMRTEYAKRWANKTRVYPGIEELLEELASREIKISILSNKPDDFTKAIVQKLFPKQPFEVVLGSHSSRPKKPDPKPALEISRKCSIPPDEFIFLGDTKVDMQTACSAQMYPIGALWGFRMRDELLASGAKHLIQKPDELLKFFGWNSKAL